jgi:crotonobetainyl-CoA:carnitine CoA-transferase CaiB-like acyl-CoA transferase
VTRVGDVEPVEVARAPTGGPLVGVRVFDLTRVLAGPFCTMILADLGAEVLKIEHPERPDYTRSIPPFAGEMSHYFLATNRNKKSVALDLRSDQGREIGLRLALACDVVVENFRPGVLELMGLDAATLRAARPDIIVCSLSGFGQTGPMSRRASVDTVVQALSGVMSVTGDPDGPPMKTGPAFGDLAGSMWATIGILAALHRRDRTGSGEHVDVALLDGLIGMLAYLAELYLVTGQDPPRTGNNHPTVPAYGRYAVQDGHLVIAAQMDPFWQAFCRAAGRPDLADDPRYRTVPDRAARYAEVEALVGDILATRDAEAWETVLAEADVPHARILSIGQALEQPSARDRGLVQDIDQPGAGPVRVPGSTIKFLGTDDPSPIRPAPRLGEHTYGVLREVLGMTEAELDRAAAAGVIAGPRVASGGAAA